MTEFIAKLSEPKTTADYKAVIEMLYNEMSRYEAQMQQDRAEIEALRAESLAITRHTDALLERVNMQLAALSQIA